MKYHQVDWVVTVQVVDRVLGKEEANILTYLSCLQMRVIQHKKFFPLFIVNLAALTYNELKIE